VNRVDRARKVYAILNKDAADFDVVLLMGRMRPADRDTVISKWLGLLNASVSSGRELDRPVIFVSTQCLEVGANFDFDGMVTECASLDA